MLWRLLFDPAPTEGGNGTTTTPAATPTATPTPTPTATPTATITVTPDEFRRLQEAQAKLAQIEADQKKALDTKEAERLKAMAEKGDAEKALNTLREAKDKEVKEARDKADTLESQILSGHKESAIATALLGTTFLSDTAGLQVKQLLEPRFEAVRDAAGVVAVREKGTLKPAAEVIKAWLASPDAAHFQKPSSAGGSGASGGDRTTPTPSATDAELAKLPWDQQLVATLKERQAGALPKYGFGRPVPSKN